MSEIDVLIQGGRVVDGSGNPWFYGDVALRADRIVDVVAAGRIPADAAREVVDGAGMVVCPGFIDIQSHSILPLMVDGRSLSKITQGVTTEVMGEGWTPAPYGGRIEDPLANSLFTQHVGEWRDRMRTWSRFGDWLEAMVEQGVSPNIGSFLGGGTLREYVKGMEMGASTAEEIAQMRRVMSDAMEDGAFGVSYALIYPPAAYADTDEIVSVCEVVSEHGGLYITHMRDERERLLQALEEALEIGRRAALPVEIYHLKASGRESWHLMPSTIARINQARAEGQDVAADMYPYVAGGTGLTAVLPPWVASGGQLYEKLRDPEVRARAREEMLNPSSDWEAMGSDPSVVMPIGFQKPENQTYVGKRLSEIAALRGQDWIEATFDLLVSEDQRISTIYFTQSEENVRLQLTQPWIKIATDAGGFDPKWAEAMGPYHPRAYGTYTRVLGRYVREQKLLGLEEAVRKMSGAVASRLGLFERGLLRKGNYADLVILDPTTVADRATFEQPHQLSVGVRDVWINGERVLQDGAHTGATPGRIVRGPGAR
jgi:N-acyl-D-aspartate/D-glutamate deacylase